MSNQSAKYYAHVDLDAFFASVEQLDHPQWKGKPVIVGGKPEDRRGVVSTASYEARAFGVHSAMPTYQAYKLCPQGIFVHGNYKRYCELSYKIMTILGDFSPQITQMSIDEAFIDLTGTEKLFGDPKETILRIKEKIKLKTGLTVSIGLAPTPYLAKIASGGELSRVMLALKTIFARTSSHNIETMIFDEIDTGIGGQVAVAVGNHIKNLSKNTQIFCITHLASIAVYADNQIKIEKSVSGEITSSNVHPIEGEERVCEIARMLSGDAQQAQSLEHARSMLQKFSGGY